MIGQQVVAVRFPEVRRRVTWAVWAERVVTHPAARVPVARCRLSTTRAHRLPPGPPRWNTIRTQWCPNTVIIIHTRLGITRRRHPHRHITRVTCHSIPGTKPIPTPDYLRKVQSLFVFVFQLLLVLAVDVLNILFFVFAFLKLFE